MTPAVAPVAESPDQGSPCSASSLAAAHAGYRAPAAVIDESPAAYKPIEAVMAAQSDLVDVVHTLRQVVCIKG